MAIVVAITLLIVGLWRGNAEVQKIALFAFAAAAVFAVPLYLSGAPAVGAVKALPDFMDTLVERHRTVAALALASCGLLGVVAASGLFLFSGRTVARWFGRALVLLGLIVGLLLVWTANLGGQIRHSEIRSAAIQQ